MQIIATERLTRTYLQKLDRQNYLATTIAAIVVTISFLWMLFHIGGDESVTLFSDSMYSVVSYAGSFCCFLVAYRGRYGPARLEPRHQLAWLLIGLGMFADATGGAYYAYLEHIGQVNPVPSLSDIGFTLFYPLTFTGLMLMPTEQKRRPFRVRIALDSLITVLCILGVCWYFFIGPGFLLQKDSHVSTPTLIALTSYPCWDMLLILGIILLIHRRAESILRPSLILFGVGIACSCWADIAYFYYTAVGTYTTGVFYIDTFWFINDAFIGLAALYQYMAIARKAHREQKNPPQAAEGHPSGYLSGLAKKRQRRFVVLQSILIYFPLSVLLAITLLSETGGNDRISFFLIILTVIAGMLLTARYLFATQQNEVLLQEREQEREAAERLRLLAGQLNEVLVLDDLFERIVAMPIAELGFDAIMLLLIEDNHEPQIQVRATTSRASETVMWRFKGAHLLYATVRSGKEMEVFWDEQEPVLPAEVLAWQEQHFIKTTLFVPLKYQGRIQGSLGFSSYTKRHFSHQDSRLAEAFTGEAATAIEHARLYQEVHEREQMAKAMANIAARLNSAVAEPSEIHELICSEGANALDADYVLLYVPDGSGQLVPLHVFIADQQWPPRPSDWPSIHPYEYEAQAFTSLQPILVELDHLSTGNTPRSLPTTWAATRSVITPNLGTVRSGGIRRRAQSLREALSQRFISTAILAPLIAKDEPLGLLILARSIPPGTNDKKAFALADLSPAQDFSEQAATAFTNALLYQQLRDAHKRQQELDQLKDQFMITASHELRTPLTAVQGYLELLVQYDDTLPHDQRQEFLQKAQRGCDELVVLLGNVMDASRLEIEAGIRPANFECVPVQEMIQSVIELIQPLVTQENRPVCVDVAKHLSVRADAARLRQVLVNLSMNALKYSPAGTPLQFSARAVTDCGPAVVISISDKGRGIAPQDQGRLFQRFVRLERDVNSPIRGSGLGLYISRRLTEAMGGKIWVESSGIEGEGSTFSIQLPVS